MLCGPRTEGVCANGYSTSECRTMSEDYDGSGCCEIDVPKMLEPGPEPLVAPAWRTEYS
jgi:hypothetical protein